MRRVKMMILTAALTIGIVSTAFAGDISGGAPNPGDISGGFTSTVIGILLSDGIR